MNDRDARTLGVWAASSVIVLVFVMVAGLAFDRWAYGGTLGAGIAAIGSWWLSRRRS